MTNEMDNVNTVELYEEHIWVWYCPKCRHCNKEYLDPVHIGEVECSECRETFRPYMY